MYTHQDLIDGICTNCTDGITRESLIGKDMFIHGKRNFCELEIYSRIHRFSVSRHQPKVSNLNNF